MKISKIKKLNEKIPDWVKLPFGNLIRHQLISNSVFVEQYRGLESMSMKSTEDKIETLKQCLTNAYTHTTYYRNLFDRIGFNPEEFSDFKQIERIPILTKEVLQREYLNIAADNIDNYYEVTTGGTSGKPTKVLMDKDAIYREWAFVYHYWSEYGYDYKVSRLATLRGVDFNGKKYKYNPLYAEIRLNPFLMGESTIVDYIKKIKTFHADFLYGYPSAVYNFCRLCLEKNIDIQEQFKAIFLISENLYPYQENVITAVTQATIAMFYGHSERAVFAEKKEGTEYIFNAQYGYTEIGENNEIITTGFINPKMPLIRYLVDDVAMPMNDGTYKILGHHSSEVLYGKEGIQISMAALNFHDDSFDGVEAYQFVQNTIGKCELHIVGEPVNGISVLAKRVQRKLGENIECRVIQKKQIEYTKRGKYKMVIQNCKICGGGAKLNYSYNNQQYSQFFTELRTIIKKVA